jgi:hypothetical protein
MLWKLLKENKNFSPMFFKGLFTEHIKDLIKCLRMKKMHILLAFLPNDAEEASIFNVILFTLKLRPFLFIGLLRKYS